MKIVIVNASLKKENSISELLTERMIPFLKGNAYGVLNVTEPMNHRTRKTILKAADALILVTPVSWGGIPSSLTALLSDMEMNALKRNMPVCTIIHGEQTDLKSLEHVRNMLKIWCEKCHLHLCMNLLIAGSDQMMAWKNIPVGNQTMKKTDEAFQQLAEALNGNEKEDVCIPAGSVFLYKHSMERYWKKELTMNGLRKSDASDRLNENSFISK